MIFVYNVASMFLYSLFSIVIVTSLGMAAGVLIALYLPHWFLFTATGLGLFGIGFLFYGAKHGAVLTASFAIIFAVPMWLIWLFLYVDAVTKAFIY